MSQSFVKVSEAQADFGRILGGTNRLILLPYFLRHLALADESAKIVVVRLDLYAYTVFNRMIICGRISHTASAKKSDSLAAQGVQKVADNHTA